MSSWTATALFTLAAGAAAFGVYTLAQWPFGAAEAGSLLFLGTLSGLLLSWQEKGLVTDPRGFMNRFMLGLMVKLLASLFAVAIILFLLPRDKGVRLGLTFAVLYLAYLAFSTIRLSNRSRRMT